MSQKIKFAVAFFFVAAIELSLAPAASARGGAAATIMNSPGYQRALEESRKRYRESYSQPYTQPPGVYPRKTWGKTWRKRGWR